MNDVPTVLNKMKYLTSNSSCDMKFTFLPQISDNSDSWRLFYNSAGTVFSLVNNFPFCLSAIFAFKQNFLRRLSAWGFCFEGGDSIYDGPWDTEALPLTISLHWYWAAAGVDLYFIKAQLYWPLNLSVRLPITRVQNPMSHKRRPTKDTGRTVKGSGSQVPAILEVRSRMEVRIPLELILKGALYGVRGDTWRRHIVVVMVMGGGMPRHGNWLSWFPLEGAGGMAGEEGISLQKGMSIMDGTVLEWSGLLS